MVRSPARNDEEYRILLQFSLSLSYSHDHDFCERFITPVISIAVVVDAESPPLRRVGHFSAPKCLVLRAHWTQLAPGRI